MPQSAPESLLAKLPPQLITQPDENARFFVDWWRRMHSERRPLVAVALKFISWAAADGAPARRFVWEVCRWPQGAKSRRPEWTFICWMVDDVGMWLKEFPSRRDAVAYFCLPPAEVMAKAQRTVPT